LRIVQRHDRLHGDGEEFRRAFRAQARHQPALFLVLLEGRRVGAIGHHMPGGRRPLGFAAGTVGGGDQVDHLDAGCHLDGAEGDADAEGQVLDAERAGVDDLAEFATFRRCIGQAHVAQQDEELVAANAAEQVLGAQRLGHAVAQLAQDLVAGGVPRTGH
jgi:hypothetical protein